MLKFLKKNKLKKVIRDNKKLKSSNVWKELMEIEMKLHKSFIKEAEKCKHLSSEGCKHKKHNGRCVMDQCPL